MEIEGSIEGFKDNAGKQHWLNDATYQPLRELVETLMATEDWAELAFAVNLVIDPIATEIGVSRLVRHHAPLHGDPITPAIILTTERDRRRNQAWTEELVRMTTATGISAADENRKVMQSWVERWKPRAIGAAKALAPVYDRLVPHTQSFDEELAIACARQASIMSELGLSAKGAV